MATSVIRCSWCLSITEHLAPSIITWANGDINVNGAPIHHLFGKICMTCLTTGGTPFKHPSIESCIKIDYEIESNAFTNSMALLKLSPENKLIPTIGLRTTDYYVVLNY